MNYYFGAASYCCAKFSVEVLPAEGRREDWWWFTKRTICNSGFNQSCCSSSYSYLIGKEASSGVDNLQRFQSKWKMNIVSRKGLISRKQRTGLLFGFLSPQNRQITLRTIFRVASKEVLFWASYIWLLWMRQLTRLYISALICAFDSIIGIASNAALMVLVILVVSVVLEENWDLHQHC